MAALTIKRAKWWAVALPVLAGFLPLMSWVWPALGLPRWYYTNGAGDRVITSEGLALGASFGMIVGLVVWLTDAARHRPLAALCTLVWALSFGLWFLWTVFGSVKALGYFDAPIGLGMAVLISCSILFAVAGVITAGLLLWLTRSRQVFRGCLAAALILAPLHITAAWLPYMDIAPGVIWHITIATVLGRYIRQEAILRTLGTCRSCGYPLVGIPPRSPCPECGGSPTLAR